MGLLNELEEILEISPPAQLTMFVQPVFQQLARCVQNQHFQVAERALFFWNNDLIGSLTTDHKKVVFPVIVPALHSIKHVHWNTTVHSLAQNVTKMLIEIDSDLYAHIVAKEKAVNRKQLADDRMSKWKSIREIADSHLHDNA